MIPTLLIGFKICPYSPPVASCTISCPRRYASLFLQTKSPFSWTSKRLLINGLVPFLTNHRVLGDRSWRAPTHSFTKLNTDKDKNPTRRLGRCCIGCKWACVSVCMFASRSALLCVCVYVFPCVCLRVCVCVFCGVSGR